MARRSNNKTYKVGILWVIRTMENIDNKDELLRMLLYDSRFNSHVQVGVLGDAPIEGKLTDEFETELREVLSDDE